MAQEFIDELNRRKAEQAKLGGFNAQPTAAPGLQPQTPMVQPESVFNAPAAGVAAPSAMTMQTPQDQLSVSPVGQPAPTVQAPQGVLSPEERTRVEGRLAQTNADIVASGGTVPSLGAVPEVPSEVIPRGGVRTLGTGGEQSPVAAARTGGIAESENQFGALETLRNVINPSAEQISANLAANSRVGGVQALPPAAVATPAVEIATQNIGGDPFGVTPEEIAAAGNQNFGQAVAQAQPENPYRTQYGVNSLNQGAIDEIKQQNAQETQAQLPSTIQNANGQDLMGFKPKYEGQSLTDYMAGRDDPSAASVQVQDPQGRFRRQAAPVAGETPEQNQSRTDALFPEQADFQQKSTDREARQVARQDFGEAQTRATGTVTDRERRTARGEGMSDADRRDIAKANMRGASASDIARGDKVAGLNGINRVTGESLVTGLTPDQQLNLRKQEFTEAQAILGGGLTAYQKISAQQKQSEIDYDRAKDTTEKAAKFEDAREASAKELSFFTDEVEKMSSARDQIAAITGNNLLTEGGLGWLSSKIPLDTDARQVERLSTEIAGNTFIRGIIESKDRGATFGPLSDLEGQKITAAFGKLTDPTMSNEDRVLALNSVIDGLNKRMVRAQGNHTRKYGADETEGSTAKAPVQGNTPSIPGFTVNVKL
jgi:hypothetical protein